MVSKRVKDVYHKYQYERFLRQKASIPDKIFSLKSMLFPDPSH